MNANTSCLQWNLKYCEVRISLYLQTFTIRTITLFIFSTGLIADVSFLSDSRNFTLSS